MTRQFFLLVSLIICISALLQGYTGFGFSILSLPLLTLLISPKIAVTILVLYSLVINIVVFLSARKHFELKRILRDMSDFWVNDLFGFPFFVVRKAENKGLLSVLKDDIVPGLLQDVPNQPSEAEFKTNPLLSRFMLLFDREGYSPAFFKRMWEKKIACCTYRKYVKDKWDLDEFHQVNVKLSNGEIESSDKIIQKLCEEISNTETIFPGTDLRLITKLVSE